MALLFKDFLLALMELYLLSATAQITTILKFILTLVEHGVDRDKIATGSPAELHSSQAM